MADKRSLQDWILLALMDSDGEASVLEVSKWVWQNREDELRRSGNLFYTWQYDLRWAAQLLRNEGVLQATGRGRGSTWRLANRSPKQQSGSA